ncbi:hypothetical protein F0562_018003 [Nyssa sinensis]|uniref:Uncharacterized protein n=1 Tax=Nyssa sinensis TaxID=561372 RepID=A0A5J4ZAS4_9ASTE|nr:hypothetical protein F0562_018003 [Nyssa sinensis]
MLVKETEQRRIGDTELRQEEETWREKKLHAHQVCDTRNFQIDRGRGAGGVRWDRGPHFGAGDLNFKRGRAGWAQSSSYFVGRRLGVEGVSAKAQIVKRGLQPSLQCSRKEVEIEEVRESSKQWRCEGKRVEILAGENSPMLVVQEENSGDGKDRESEELPKVLVEGREDGDLQLEWIDSDQSSIPDEQEFLQFLENGVCEQLLMSHQNEIRKSSSSVEMDMRGEPRSQEKDFSEKFTPVVPRPGGGGGNCS